MYIPLPCPHFIQRLQRNEALDSSCESGTFYLSYTVTAGSNGTLSSQDSGLLDYDSLPLIVDTDGDNGVPRAAFESDGLCDDSGCTPTSGGSTCGALSCVEVYHFPPRERRIVDRTAEESLGMAVLPDCRGDLSYKIEIN